MNDVLVWGSGAIGGTVGAHLVRAGRRVTFVDADAEHVAASCRQGLRIEGPIASFTVPVDMHLPQALEGSWSTVLLCVKAHDTEVAARQLAEHLVDDGTVVSLQNGLNEEVLGSELGAERVVGAFVNFGSDLVGPGRIHFGGRGAVVVGELDGRDTQRLRDLHRLLLRFEPNAVASDNVLGYLWAKLAYGGMLFATALTNDSIADALEDERFRPVYVGIAREAVRVALAEGIRPQPFDGFEPDAFGPDAAHEAVEASVATIVRLARRSAKTHTGVWRDLAVRKRRTEVDSQMGAVVRHADRAGIDVPLTRATVRLIHDVEEGRRPLSRDNLVDLLAAVGRGAVAG